MDLDGRPALRDVGHAQGEALTLSTGRRWSCSTASRYPGTSSCRRFSTPLLALAEPLTAVFDAVAASCRFVSEGGTA